MLQPRTSIPTQFHKYNVIKSIILSYIMISLKRTVPILYFKDSEHIFVLLYVSRLLGRGVKDILGSFSPST